MHTVYLVKLCAVCKHRSPVRGGGKICEACRLKLWEVRMLARIKAAGGAVVAQETQ